MKLGKSLNISTDGSVIACSTTCEIDLDVDIDEVSSPNTGGYHTYTAGRKGWGVNCSWLVKSKDHLVGNVMKLGNTYDLEAIIDGSETIIEGQAICTKCKITSSVGNLIKGSFSFKGSGSF